MLYTLSNAEYNTQTLADIFAQLNANDAVVLWQDGVLQAVKKPQIFANLPNVFVLKADLEARGLAHLIAPSFQQIDLAELVTITEKFAPQVAL